MLPVRWHSEGGRYALPRPRFALSGKLTEDSVRITIADNPVGYKHSAVRLHVLLGIARCIIPEYCIDIKVTDQARDRIVQRADWGT